MTRPIAICLLIAVAAMNLPFVLKGSIFSSIAAGFCLGLAWSVFSDYVWGD